MNGGQQMSLGERLKQGRLDKKLSQTEVAELLSISRQSISKWENGHNYPDIDNLILLSEIYEISIDILLKEKEYDTQKCGKAEEHFEDQSMGEINKDIDENCTDLNTEEPTKIDKKQPDEGLVLVIISLVSCLVTPVGIIIAALVLHRNKKANTYYRVITILCICSILVNIYVSYIFISDYFNWGVENNIQIIE